MGSSILIVLLAFALIIILELRNSSRFIGRAGEHFVNNKLGKLDTNYYITLSNILLPSANNRISTTQIDQIVVSNFGVFCVETKAYSGWIFGRAGDKYWTQVIFHNKTRFYNPLWQNYGHVKAIENLVTSLNIKIPIYSYVAFPDADDLKITGTDSVGYACDIINKIKSHNQFVISDVDRGRIVTAIRQANIAGRDTLREHIKNVKSLKDS